MCSSARSGSLFFWSCRFSFSDSFLARFPCFSFIFFFFALPYPANYYLSFFFVCTFVLRCRLFTFFFSRALTSLCHYPALRLPYFALFFFIHFPCYAVILFAR